MKAVLNSLQVCRAIAALLVVLDHFSISCQTFFKYEFLKSFFNFGHAGVSFFFVLSGFIICYTHWHDIHGDASHLKRYALNRMVRIFPAYWPILIVTSLLYFLLGTLSMADDRAVITLISFIKNIFLISYDNKPIVTVAWTLQYEIIFYAFFAFFIINQKIGKIILLAWLSLIISFNLFPSIFPPGPGFCEFFFGLYVMQFFMGCLLTNIIKKWPSYVRHPHILLWIGIIGFIAYGIYEDYYISIHEANSDMIFAFFSALIILALVKMELNKSIRCPKFLVFLGGASYAIYLTHNMLLSLFFRLCQHMPLHQFPFIQFMLSTMFTIGITVLIGCLYYKFYEIPMMTFIKNKLTFKHRPELVLPKT